MSNNPTLDAYRRILLTTSTYFASGYYFYGMMEQLLPLGIRVGGLRLNPVGLIGPILFSWFIGWLAGAILGKRGQYSDFSNALVQFFLTVFLNSALVMVGAFVFQPFGPGGQSLLKYLGIPFLLYAGYFFHFAASLYLFAGSDEMRIGGKPVSLAGVILIRLATAGLFALSLIPLVWVIMDYLQAYIT